MVIARRSGEWLVSLCRRGSRSPVVVVFLWALGLRLIFGVLTAGTFDADEFVIIVLSRAVAHGAIPYRDVMFFHPPGMLVLFAAMQTLLGWWWPLARVSTMLIDSITAVLVWRIGQKLFNDRGALVAGLLYGASPIALVSAVRVGPDPIITFLGVAGLVALLSRPSRRAAMVAGLCLGLAFWTKYPALMYLPIYALVAPRRLAHVLAGFGLTVIFLFAPFLTDPHAFYSQTVLWQLGARNHADLFHRLSSVGAYWLLLNLPAAIALWRYKAPAWLRAGFCLGLLFLFTAEAYYHYFAPIVPFAALLGAPLLARLAQPARRLAVAGALVLSGLWAIDVGHGNSSLRLFVSATRFAESQQTARVLDNSTSSSAAVLTDQFQYALLAGRAPANEYFWNMHSMVTVQSLERSLSHVAAVVWTKGGHTYPAGFDDFLADGKYPRIETARTTIWLIHADKG